jgi:hypothetical protein
MCRRNIAIRIEYCPTDNMVGDFFNKPLQGWKFTKFRCRILGTTTNDIYMMPPNSADPVRKECVGACDSSITDVCDESGSATLWIKVVSKKQKNKADGLVVATNLGGKQSEKLEKLTLFTKSKLAKQ